mgnify:CR=1 FL=1
MPDSVTARHLLQVGRPLVVGAISDAGEFTVTPSGCDLIELRLDSLGTSAEVISYAQNAPLPLLITARGPSEGGQSDWSLSEREQAYRTLLPLASFIDIELRDFEALTPFIEEARAAGVVMVGSFHDFDQTPPLPELLEKRHPLADLHKFALMTRTGDDVVTHLALLQKFGGGPVSVMGMGPIGAAARPLMARCGSLLNYGYLGRTPTAPDQWPAKLLAETLSL